ncbi:MAG TPA: DUF177 domain-containing protein [Aquifex aeolicus]|uniref:DUF177 domain-containing protein n=1 Tax=Aquifex aeolicus TaxID=63363 RepID=A0A7C5L8P0_AQUAO|nr:DUF177 domain-containing protein [Aquifex aeolicus]
MVTLNLRDIFERFDVFEGSFTIPPENLRLPADLGEIREPVRVYVVIRKDRNGYAVSIDMEGNVELECSRCLEPFSKDLPRHLEKHIESYPREEHVVLSQEDLDVSFMEEPDTVNVEELVREEIILSIPMKPLCRPDCGGFHLADLFEKESPADPRFAILKDLLTG